VSGPSETFEEYEARRGAARQRSERHAEQTRKRIRSRQRERERARLLRLGVDPAWLERVLGDA
jgi:hypothetical protein